MGLTSALNTSLNGLALNETAIDIYGNNIANANTNGFKASRIQFSTQLARTISFGSKASGDSGGSNPLQIGLGAQVAEVTPDFSQGTISTTTNPSDLAIQGDGFFKLKAIDGSYLFTRNGSFRLDSDKRLSNSEGLRVQGYGVDSDFNVVTTTQKDLEINLGVDRLAQPTSKIVLSGALSPQGTVSTQGTLQLSEALIKFANSGNTTADSTTKLVDLRRSADPSTAMFTVNSGGGDAITFSPVKGGRTLETKSMSLTNTTTLGDLEEFMKETLGIQSYTPPSTEPTGGPSTFGVDDSSGQIRILGNRGTANDFDIPVGSLRTNGNVVSIGFTPSRRADGESASTAFTVYDSLGNALTVRMTAIMESQDSSATTYRYFLESPDQKLNPDPNFNFDTVDIAMGNGTIAFDNVGHVSNTQGATFFNLGRNGTSAVDPLRFELDYSNVSGISSSGSVLNLTSQDGTSPGTLSSYTIDDRGRIIGAFDNGIVRTLGQIVLARFSNPAGLIQAGSDNFQKGNSSGEPQESPPGTTGAGTIRSGAIELSNTDIGRSLVDLIVASTNYRGNARVISSVDQLVSELLLLGRS